MSYQIGTATASPGHGAYAIAIGDMNCDGYDDIVTGNPNDTDFTAPDDAPTIGIMLSNGDGTFAPMVQYSAMVDVASPGAIALGDLDGDGKLDVVAMGGEIGAQPFYLLNDGTGKLGAPVALTLMPNDPAENQDIFGANIAAVDMNGDGTTDIVLEPSGDSGYVAVLLNGGGAKFSGDVDYQLIPDTAMSPSLAGLAVADVNGDGKPDVLALDGCNGEVVVSLNSGTGSLAAPTTFPVMAGTCMGADENRLAAADFDGDGNIDVAFSDQTTNVGVALNMGGNAGTFKAPTYVTVPNHYGVSLIAADVNHDGQPDLVLSQGTDGTVVVLLNTGGGKFATPVQLPVGTSADRIAAGNFQGTGVLGLAFSSYDDIGHPMAPGPSLFIAKGTCGP
jgi:hypothetical protein